MSSMRRTYGAALQVTMRSTAGAYGYTLSTAATLSLLTQTAEPGSAVCDCEDALAMAPAL